MRPKTSSQSPQCFCRNRRMLGYQGLSSRFSIQRHSDGVNRTTQTGMPKAPAQWAAAVSTVITRSRFFMTAAVSRNVFNLLPTIDDRQTIGDFRQLFAPGPVCRLNSWTPASFASGCKLSQRTERKRSLATSCLACQAIPILKEAEWEWSVDPRASAGTGVRAAGSVDIHLVVLPTPNVPTPGAPLRTSRHSPFGTTLG